MPELPDVEVFRRYFDRTSLHYKIESVKVTNEIVLADVGRSALGRKLHDRSFTGSQRHGKQMFAELDDGGWLTLHFGMTGFLKYFKNASSAPDHPRVVVAFDNGYRLAWDSQRMIGRVGLTESTDTFVEHHQLGPDAMDIDADELGRRLGDHRGMIKPALMDQSLVAGIGNVYSDELLFQVRVHPRTPAGDLTEAEMLELHGTIGGVFDTVIDAGAVPERMPAWLLTAHRGRDDTCPRCGGELKKIAVSGRNGYLCPTCQPD